MTVFINMYILSIFFNSFHRIHEVDCDVMCIHLSGCLIHETTEHTGISFVDDQNAAAGLCRKAVLAVPFRNSHCQQDSS
jgi:hypothetical protein